MSDLTSQERRYLHRFLTERFNLSELKTLAYYQNYPFEDYPHDTISDLAREMLQYSEREGQLGEFLKAILEERPDDELARIYARQPLPEKAARVKLELIIRQASKENAQEIRDRIARTMGWRQDEIGIIFAASGSLRLLLSVPRDKLPALLNLAKDPQFWQPYEVESARPFAELPKAEQARWYRLVMEQAPPPVPPAQTGTAVPSASATTGGLPLIVKIIIGVLILVGIITAGVLIWGSRQPELTVYNLCPNPLPIPAPEAVRSILSLPEAIPAGGSMNMPVLTGTGTYELLVTREGVMVLILPRPIPGVGSRVELGEMDRGTAITLNGRPLDPPQQFPIEVSQTYELVICAPR